MEASVMARALVDLKIRRDQHLLCLKNLPDKIAEHIQLISGAGTVQQLWRAVNESHIRSGATGSIERAHAVQGSPIRGKILDTCRQIVPNQNVAMRCKALYETLFGCNSLTQVSHCMHALRTFEPLELNSAALPLHFRMAPGVRVVGDAFDCSVALSMLDALVGSCDVSTC